MAAMSGTWWEYVQRITRRAQQKEIAGATGLEQSSISRWARGKNTSAEAAVTFARAYNQPPIEALIAAGYLKTDDVGGIVKVESSIRDLPTEQLLEELQSRYKDLRGTPERGRRRSDKPRRSFNEDAPDL